MHVHNVSDFSPPGYQLSRTEYAGGATRHVFSAPGLPELACECSPADADAEREALAAFQLANTPRAPEPEPAAEAPVKSARKRA